MPVVFTEEMAELIKATVRDHMRGRNSTESFNGNRNTPRVPSQWAIVNGADIEAPENGITEPTTGSVEILTRNRQSDHLERSGRIKTLIHRYEGITLVKDMLIRIKHVNGEWMLEAADCGALGNPPT